VTKKFNKKYLIERKWREAQKGPEGKLIREMGITKEDWMKENGYEVKEPDEVD